MKILHSRNSRRNLNNRYKNRATLSREASSTSSEPETKILCDGETCRKRESIRWRVTIEFQKTVTYVFHPLPGKRSQRNGSNRGQEEIVHQSRSRNASARLAWSTGGESHPLPPSQQKRERDRQREREMVLRIVLIRGCQCDSLWRERGVARRRDVQAPEGEETRHEFWLRSRGGSADDVEKWREKIAARLSGTAILAPLLLSPSPLFFSLSLGIVTIATILQGRFVLSLPRALVVGSGSFGTLRFRLEEIDGSFWILGEFENCLYFLYLEI